MSNDQRPARVKVYNSGSAGRAPAGTSAQPVMGPGAPVAGASAAAAGTAPAARRAGGIPFGMIALFTASSLAGAALVTLWLLFPQVLP